MADERRPPVAIPPNLMFYASPPHECSYVDGRQAVTVFADPRAPLDTGLYGALIDLGFRRSGEYLYRPRCPGCAACLSARIPVARFRADRAQQRTARRNANLTVRSFRPAFIEEHYALYRRYIATRHAGGGMDVDIPERFMEFLASSWCESEFVEFRAAGRLVAVAVMDVLPQGLSAVYTFFDPDLSRRSLGTHAILWQVGEARRRGLPYLYLGYWIEELPKMAYKTRFKPLELFRDGQWQPYIEGS